MIRERTGRMVRPGERAYKGYPYAFVIDTFRIAQAPVFIRLKDFLPLGHPRILPRLYDERTFFERSGKLEAGLRRQHFIFGILGGTFVAFFLFPLAYFVFNRQRYFLYYAVYVLLSFIFVCFTFERFGHMDLLFSNAPKLMEHIETPLNSFSIIFYFLFLRSFLDAKEKAPLLHWLLGFLVVYQLSFQVLDLFVFKLIFNNYEVAYKYAALGTIPGLLTCLYLLFVVFRWKRADATFIGIGMVFFLAGVVASILEFEGKIPSAPYSLFDNHHIFFQFGIVLELFFFSFALSHRNRSTVRARIEAQSRLRHLEELDQAKNRLFTNITHEFRTPLQVILGVAEQIRKAPRLQLEQRLGLIRKNGQHLLSMVSQMLDLAKLESGHLQLQPVCSDVIPYLKYMADSSRSAAAGKNINIHFESKVSALEMDHDPERLRQVVYNLLSNAIRFTPEGGEIQLCVEMEPSPPDGIATDEPFLSGGAGATGYCLVISVLDNGIGMDEETQARIFERFYQAPPEWGGSAKEGHSDRLTAAAGLRGDRGGLDLASTGIGLALVKELVALMNGRITLESQKGKGTAFRVELPITRLAKKIGGGRFLNQNEELKPAPPSSQGRQKSVFPPAMASGEMLLIVEDNEDVRYYLRSLLADSYQVVEAVDGEEGLAKAIELIPDIIISDIMMPGIDGNQLCRALKNDPRTSHIPIILLTAKATEQDKISGLEHGADGYLYKPINEQELSLRLQNLIELRQKIREKYGKISPMELTKTEEPGHEVMFLDKINQIVLRHLEDENFGPDSLCTEAGISRTQLYRKLNALTGMPLARYIRSVRLHAARKLLETTRLRIGEVAYKVGFKDPSYFTRTFSQEFGMTPSKLPRK